MRNIYHRYDLHDNKHDYEKQMAGQVAVIILSGIAVACLLAVVTFIAKLLVTMLVIVQ